MDNGTVVMTDAIYHQTSESDEKSLAGTKYLVLFFFVMYHAVISFH